MNNKIKSGFRLSKISTLLGLLYFSNFPVLALDNPLNTPDDGIVTETIIGTATGVISGTVTDQNGTPLSQATIQIMGTRLSTKTDENGQFRFSGIDSQAAEIHVAANGFAHHNHNLSSHKQGSINISFALARSPIEVIDVTATPFHASVMESATPVSVLSGETLRRQQAATLGDSLEKLVGVNTSFHANVASTPIIRGLSGPRVLITQNGLDVSDVSRIGPDHSVSSEVSTAKQIEVLRGPATLFFGSGAIGGVVNVVDQRVPSNSDSEGEWLFERDSVNDQKLGAFTVKTGNENFAFYADAFFRDADDYAVPVNPESEDAHEHDDEHSEDEHSLHSGNYKVENSQEESSGYTFGTSYLFDRGFVGVSVGRLERTYGIPGHSHGGEEDEHDEHDEDEHSEEEHHEDEHGHGSEEEGVFSELTQDRYQLIGEIDIDSTWLNTINFKAAYTDYEHSEIETGVAGTTFKNETVEVRTDLLHQAISGWRGGFSLHYKNSDAQAQGEEAFTPPSTNEMFALALMEEKHYGDVLVQLGARIERVTVDADMVRLPMLEFHSHDDEEHGEDHSEEEHMEEDETTLIFGSSHKFTPITLSAGAVWDFVPGYNVGVSLSRSERAPSPAELFSFGPHIGTGTYEVGALFAVTENTDESPTIGLSTESIDKETSNNIDLTFRKTQGDVGFVFNVFYNQVDNYYYQIETGLFAESGHDHGEHSEMDEHDDHEEHDDHDEHAEHGGEDEHSDELPVFIFQTDDVRLYGFEAQVAWQVNDEFKTTIFSDYVRAKLVDGGDLPRTPPMRIGAEFAYTYQDLYANLGVVRYQSQDNIADFESVTDGYTLVDATISYQLPMNEQDISVYLQGSNLTDTEARVHSSFLKDLAPRAGRSFALGIRGYF